MSLILLQNWRRCLCSINISKIEHRCHTVWLIPQHGCLLYRVKEVAHLHGLGLYTFPSEPDSHPWPSWAGHSLKRAPVPGQGSPMLCWTPCKKKISYAQKNFQVFFEQTCSSEPPCLPLPTFQSRPRFGFEPSPQKSLPVGLVWISACGDNVRI